MADLQTARGIPSGEDRVGKLEDVILLVFCALIAVGGLGVVAWQLATGRLLSIDGLWLAAICLTLAAVFGGNVAWSIYKGEMKQMFGGASKEPGATPPGPTASGTR